jgi:hypothetical protein
LSENALSYYPDTAMRRLLFFTGLLGAAICFAQAESEKPIFADARPTGRITAFFPAGGRITLEGPQGSFELESGLSMTCPAGDYLLQFRHPDYAIYMRKVEISGDSQRLILPELERTRAYWAAQATALEKQKTIIESSANRQRRSAWIVGGALSAVAAGAVGGLEWLLTAKKAKLDSTYGEYSAASAAEAPGIWARIEDQKAEINNLRLCEYFALGGVGLFAGAGLTVASSAPTTVVIDRQIRKFREEAEE